MVDIGFPSLIISEAVGVGAGGRGVYSSSLRFHMWKKILLPAGLRV